MRIRDTGSRGRSRTTGTGKTFVCMQVIHKILRARPNSKILFLEDRKTSAKRFKSKKKNNSEDGEEW